MRICVQAPRVVERLLQGWLVFMVAAMWAIKAPLAHGAAMGFDDARHLLVRTTYSASSAEIDSYARLTRAQAVERLLAGTRKHPQTQLSAELDQWTPRSQIRALPEQERRAWLRQTIQKGQDLRGWWFKEMLVTDSPFTERMTMFWHNHFVSSLQKVRPTRLMYRQNLLLREHALGNFADLLHAVSRDPAMIVYLDNASNRKGHPNENFAREVMELFTLGEGNYTEQDIKEAARAFTGWGINGETGEFVFRPIAHDDGIKTVLGRSGPLNGADVLEILLAQPQSAELIVRKLWREFISPTPEEGEVKRIAEQFRASRYDIRTVLRAVLTSEHFYAAQNRASLIKSPIDLLVGTLRQFRFEIGDPYPFVVIARQLGQDIMTPPNVKGWPGGESWINASTLLARKQILERLFRSAERIPADMVAMNAPNGAPMANAMQARARTRFQQAMSEVRFDEQRWFAQTLAGGIEDLTRILLPMAPIDAADGGNDRLSQLRAVLLDPVYQLK